MPKPNAAEVARNAHANELRARGAHAIEVGKVTRNKKHRWAVIAWFETKPKDLPKTLDGVPLVVKVGPKFTPD